MSRDLDYLVSLNIQKWMLQKNIENHRHALPAYNTEPQADPPSPQREQISIPAIP